jgi:glyoxylase-like metal-dependent hydrolase (beta-lactamase superfamily II)
MDYHFDHVWSIEELLAEVATHSFWRRQMTNKAVGVAFLRLAVVLFMSRYVITLWYIHGQPITLGDGDLWNYLNVTGHLPWALAFIFAIAGIGYLIKSDRSRTGALES